jgi:hypothetical protein
MEESMIRDHLALAEKHVFESEGHIARQREIVAELERDGHAKAAQRGKKLLGTMLDLHDRHVADRARLAGELKRKVAIKDAPLPGAPAENPEQVLDAPHEHAATSAAKSTDIVTARRHT